MKIREEAERMGLAPVGKLKRMPDIHYGIGNRHYPWYMDEAGNEFLLSDDGKELGCIITADGGVI